MRAIGLLKFKSKPINLIFTSFFNIFGAMLLFLHTSSVNNIHKLGAREKYSLESPTQQETNISISISMIY